MTLPEQYFVSFPIEGYENMRFYRIPHPYFIDEYFDCYANTNDDWEQVAVVVKENGSMPERCPYWEEMHLIKAIFWEEEEAVMQLHPPESDYINNHPFCLHLWRPLKQVIPLPPSHMVGIK